MNKKPKGIQESLNFIIEKMAMKDDVVDIVREEVRDIVKEEVSEALRPVEIKIDKLDTKLNNFENNEIDKRKQLTVRMGNIEKHLNIKPPVGTTH